MELEKFKFLTEPDNALKCLICLDVAEEPWQHDKCGKLFCKECLEEHKSRSFTCPNCRGKNPRYFQDTKSKRDIQALPVKCDNVDKDCTWQGTVATLKEHREKCEFALVKCPKRCLNEDKKVQCFMRKDIDSHLENDCPNRAYKCTYCEKEDTYAKIMVHDKSCPEKELPCPNAECGEIFRRRAVKRHLEECGHTEIPCKYQKLGCTVKMKRNAISTHENDDKLHLRMVMDAVVTKEDGKPVKFKVTEFSHKCASQEEFFSPTFYTGPRGYHMQVIVRPNGYHSDDYYVSVRVKILKGQYDEQLKWPFKGDVCITLLNQASDDRHFKKKISLKTTNAIIGYSLKLSKFISHSKLQATHGMGRDSDSNDSDDTDDSSGSNILIEYLKEDTLYFSVNVDDYHRKPWLE